MKMDAAIGITHVGVNEIIAGQILKELVELLDIRVRYLLP
jgi:hypothetical protein